MSDLPRGSQSPQWTFESDDDRAERVSVPVRGPFATNNSESLRDAVLSGLGIALLPDFSAREADSAHRGAGAAARLAAGGRVCRESVRHPPLRAARIAGGRDFQRYLKSTFS
nr:transcriptional regulator [Raoultella sp. NCTC 9187]